MENKLSRQPATPEEIWAILREVSESQKDTDQRMKETDRQMQETDRLLKETKKEADRRMKETDRQMQETDRRMEETDRLLKETIKETDRRMKKLDSLFTNQWGALIESLVEGDLVPLLRKRNILVRRTVTNVPGEHDGEYAEFDIVSMNGAEIVAVEVKTTLRPEDVTHFLRKLAKFTLYTPEYKGKTVYGAVAFLKADESVQVHAARQGLFVIRATGDSASIVNDEEFRPRVFG